MNFSKMTVIAGLLSTSFYATQVQAECSVELPYEQLVDCIVVEGSGSKYKATEQKNEPTTVSESKQETKQTSNEMASAN